MLSFRHPNQKFCLRDSCKKSKKAQYQREKIKTDADYKANQKDANKRWIENNPNYYKEYRKKNPDKIKRNAILQKIRNYKNRAPLQNVKTKSILTDLIAKMELVNSPKEGNNQYVGTYWLIPMIAKMELVNKSKSSKDRALPQIMKLFV